MTTITCAELRNMKQFRLPPPVTLALMRLSGRFWSYGKRWKILLKQSVMRKVYFEFEKYRHVDTIRCKTFTVIYQLRLYHIRFSHLQVMRYQTAKRGRPVIWTGSAGIIRSPGDFALMVFLWNFKW